MISMIAEGVATPPPAQNNFGDTLSDGVAGPTALLIIVLLVIATVLLIRNMNKRLRRLPAQFPVTSGAGASVAQAEGAPSAPARSTGGEATAAAGTTESAASPPAGEPRS